MRISDWSSDVCSSDLVNVSGAGVLKNAPHREAAVKFQEYLASPEAQHYFAEGNNEYPVVEGVDTTAAVKNLGTDFKIDPVTVAVYGSNQPERESTRLHSRHQCTARMPATACIT